MVASREPGYEYITGILADTPANRERDPEAFEVLKSHPFYIEGMLAPERAELEGMCIGLCEACHGELWLDKFQAQIAEEATAVVLCTACTVEHAKRNLGRMLLADGTVGLITGVKDRS